MSVDLLSFRSTALLLHRTAVECVYVCVLFHFNKILLLKRFSSSTDESFSYTSHTHTPIEKENLKLDVFNSSFDSPRQQWEQIEISLQMFIGEEDLSNLTHV